MINVLCCHYVKFILSMGVSCSMLGCNSSMDAYVILFCGHYLCWNHGNNEDCYCEKCNSNMIISKIYLVTI